MKTVVIVHHTCDWGGGTKSLLDLCEMLRDTYKVVVCIPHGNPEFSKKIVDFGCSAYEFSDPVPFVNIYSGSPPLISVISFRSLRSLTNIKRTGEEILSLNPDVVIFNSLVTAVTARFLSKKTKVICIDRETLTSDISIILYHKLLEGCLDAITFLSDYEKRKFHFSKPVSYVFPDCVHLEKLSDIDKKTARQREGVPEDKYTVLYMGGSAKIKGPDIILEAFNKLDNRFLLLFVGKVNEEKFSKNQLLHDSKYPGILRFKKRFIKYYYTLKGTPKLLETGLRDAVDDLIIASDLVVFPSTSVHQPRPCIEAGAYGKPVIISDYKETREYFKNGYNALTFKPGDADDLVSKIRYSYDHKAEMKQIGENNRKMTEKNHDFNEGKRLLCFLIERVCGNAD